MRYLFLAVLSLAGCFPDSRSDFALQTANTTQSNLAAEQARGETAEGSLQMQMLSLQQRVMQLEDVVAKLTALLSVKQLQIHMIANPGTADEFDIGPSAPGSNCAYVQSAAGTLCFSNGASFHYTTPNCTGTPYYDGNYLGHQELVYEYSTGNVYELADSVPVKYLSRQYPPGVCSGDAGNGMAASTVKRGALPAQIADWSWASR